MISTRHFLRQRRGSALILVVLLTLMLAAVSIVALRDIARTTSATATYRTRTQAQLTSDAATRVFANYAGTNATPLMEVAHHSLFGEDDELVGMFAGENHEGLDMDGDNAISREERRITATIQGPILTFTHSVLASNCGGLCTPMIPHPGTTETGLFRTEYLDQLFSEPHGHITPLRGSELWQVALLELWLQTNEL